METEKLNLIVFIKEYPIGLAITKKIQNILYYLITQKIEIKVISNRSKFKQPSEIGYDNGIQYREYRNGN